MNSNRIFSMLVALVSTISVLSGQHIASFNHLSTNQGLLSPKYNNFVHKDGEGLVWVSSIAGVYQFDGKRVKAYHADENDPRSILLEVGLQSMMQEGRDGNLWFSAGIALTRYNRSTDDFTHFYHVDALGDTIRSLYQWSYVDPEQGRVFSSAGRLLLAGSLNDPANLEVVDSVFVGNQDYMVRQKDGCYLLIQPRIGEPKVALSTYCGNVREQTDTLVGPPGEAVVDAKIDRSGNVVVATSTAIFLVRKDTPTWGVIDAQDLRGSEIKAIEHLAGDQFVVGTKDRGLFLLNMSSGAVAPILVNSGRKVKAFQESVTHLYVDSNQVLWVSTEENGVFYASLASRKFKHLAFEAEGLTTSVIALAESSKGELFVLYADRLEVLDGDIRSTIQLPPQKSAFDQATSLAVDRRGRVWVGTYNSLLLLEPGRRSFVKTALYAPSDLDGDAGATSIQELASGALLVTTNTNYSYVISPDLASTELWAPVFTQGQIVEFDRNDNVLASTSSDSLILLQRMGDNYQIDTVHQRLGVITSLIYDEKMAGYWVARFGGLHWLGKNRLGGWELKTIGKTKGEAIASMELGTDGTLWYSTPGHLKHYFPEEDSLASYTLADGIQGDVFNLGASVRRSNGELLFGGVNGVTVVPVGQLSSRIGLAKPEIVGVKLNGVDFSETRAGNELFLERLRLPYDSTRIELSVAALEYSDPDNSELYYSISEEGVSEKRVRVGDSRKVLLERLREGDHIFRLWAENADGTAAEEYRELLIIVDPPWYRTRTAYAAYTFGIIGLTLLSGWMYLRRRLKAEQEELKIAQAQAAVAKAESAAAAAETLAAETETSVLRLQMNPHFIFNSLNSINSFVVKEDIRAAHEYLIDFADVIRDILNRSAQPLTRLDLAIELLKNYLSVEKRRLNGKLTFRVDLAPDVDTFCTYVPTMILQPFVENAIWHGISGLKGGGTIVLGFRLSDSGQMLVATVEDNGRGRDATKNKQGKHKSMSMDITQRRLELLNKHRFLPPDTAPAAAESNQEPERARHEIIDLYSDKGQPCGTRVILHLPLEYPQYDESSSY